DGSTVDAMLELYEKLPTGVMQALARRGLEGASLSDDQRSKLAAMPSLPEGASDVLAKLDEVRSDKAKLGWRNLEGQAAQLILGALAFTKNADGVANLMSVLEAWDKLNYGGLDAEEIGHMHRVLDGYLQSSEGMSFVYGILAADAPKEIANVVNARLVAKLEPELKANPPKLKDEPLTREQADFVLTLLPNIKDDAALDKMIEAMGSARSLFEKTSSWSRPSAPMCPASFELLRRLAVSYQDAAAASPDGKLDYRDFASSMRAEVQDIQSALRPRLSELEGSNPRWEGVALSREAATYVKGLLQDHLRSSMSVDNIGRALKVIAQANGGRVEGAGLRQLQGIIEDYKASFPETRFLDFNKLERIASAAVEGKTLPLCTLNGEKVGLGEFYLKVGQTVAAAVDGSQMLHAWQTERWGMRAKQLVEILDVVAEQTARGEGPIALLRQTYPNAQISVQATGADGCHEQFIYVVKNGAEELKFTQGSDGTISRYHKTADPLLFTANIGAAGDLNVDVADRISTRRYPLQNTYGVGDRVDISYIDNEAIELQEEGKNFSTRYKLLEAEIVAFDATGNYTVKYTTPAGQEETKTVPLSTLRKANNPHYFKPSGDYFSDVTININSDEALRSFIEGAKPIIERHLPTDGSLLALSPDQLARRQKACIEDLQRYAAEAVQYPNDKGSSDKKSERYHELTADYWNRFPLGELVTINRGVCRHQCILAHLLLQYAGIDSRLASGAANTSSNAFRGYHIWTEVTLADNERYLSDQTWDDATIPLWSGAYSVDKRRIEMYDRTARYDYSIVN
ncbi:MAG: transglutaminase domain-containing protein, partial [Myxococcales bacterium]